MHGGMQCDDVVESNKSCVTRLACCPLFMWWETKRNCVCMCASIEVTHHFSTPKGGWSNHRDNVTLRGDSDSLLHEASLCILLLQGGTTATDKGIRGRARGSEDKMQVIDYGTRPAASIATKSKSKNQNLIAGMFSFESSRTRKQRPLRFMQMKIKATYGSWFTD